MRERNTLNKNSNRQKKKLNLQSEDNNQLSETKNKQPLSTPRHDHSIVSLIQEDKLEEAKALASEHYLPPLEEKVISTYPFINESEIQRAFDNRFAKLKKEVKEGRIFIENEELKSSTSLENIFVKGGLALIKNLIQKRENNPDDYEVIESLMQGSDRSFTKAYHRFRDYFFGFAKNKFPNCDEEMIQDVYQDVWMVIIKDYIRRQRMRVEDGYIIGLSNGATLKVFMVSIGKRMLARKTLLKDLDPYIEEARKRFDEDNSDFDFEELLQFLYTKIKELSFKCKRLLFYQFWLGLTFKEIKEVIGTGTVGALRVTAKRCRDSLKDKMQNDKK